MASILVHGGAGGWHRDAARLARGLDACREAAAAGRDLLRAGAPAVDAVEAAVRVLEDAPVMNAGRGAFPKANGVVELDAMIMDGATLALGAVAAVPRVRNAVSLARAVMDDGRHTLLVAEGASAFADAIGFLRSTNEELLAPRSAPPLVEAEDTVGAVAIDDAGNVAAATSTGGVPQQLPGRVGDSPLVGSGGYADNATAAVSATGTGELLMKVVISKQVCEYVAGGMTAREACEAAIALLARRVNGTGGLIAIDRAGRAGLAFNTPAMTWAFGAAGGAIASGHAPGEHP